MSLRTSNDRAQEPTEIHHFERMAVTDIVDVIYDMDENACRALLAKIAISAQFATRFPEPDFAAQTWKRFLPVIQAWAEERAELARERGYMS